MELFRCVFISLVAFLSAVRVQSTKNVSIYYAGYRMMEGDNYLWIDCSSSKSSLNSSQCKARVDGSSKDAYSTFQILKRNVNPSKNQWCIQHTMYDGTKYALKVVNESSAVSSRVVFEEYPGCNNVTEFSWFLFEREGVTVGGKGYFRYKSVMFNNPSMCLGKEGNSLEKLSLLDDRSNGGDELQRHCLFKRYFHR